MIGKQELERADTETSEALPLTLLTASDEVGETAFMAWFKENGIDTGALDDWARGWAQRAELLDRTGIGEELAEEEGEGASQIELATRAMLKRGFQVGWRSARIADEQEP
jgi:hypothetical protein